MTTRLVMGLSGAAVVLAGAILLISRAAEAFHAMASHGVLQ